MRFIGRLVGFVVHYKIPQINVSGLAKFDFSAPKKVKRHKIASSGDSGDATICLFRISLGVEIGFSELKNLDLGD